MIYVVLKSSVWSKYLDGEVRRTLKFVNWSSGVEYVRHGVDWGWSVKDVRFRGPHAREADAVQRRSDG